MHRRRGLLIAASFAVLAALALSISLLWKSGLPQAPLVTADLSEIEYPKTPLLDRIPRSWGWLWRLRDKVFPRDTITLSTCFVEVNPSVLDALPAAIPGSWESDGFELRILGEQELEGELAGAMKSSGINLLSAPRFSTADRIGAKAAMGGPVPTEDGTKFAGIDIGVYPRVLASGTDLVLTATITEAITNRVGVLAEPGDLSAISIRTNLLVGVRAPIPKQGGLLLLKRQPIDSTTPSIGLFITVDVPKHKRRK